MEFRYRAGDRPPPAADAPPLLSTNPSFSFLSACSLPGCCIGVGQSEDHFQEAIRLREIEKEQIRHEIIVAETARRRELIAEVVQEMSIEREMALEDEKLLTMSINQRKLLLNRNMMCTYGDPLMSSYGLFTSPMMQFPPLPEVASVFESNKEKLIFLSRPDSDGAKRKAEDAQTGNERAKRRADGLCLAKDLYLSWPQNKAKKTLTNVKPISVETGETVSSKQVEIDPKHRFKFWCDVCVVGTSCEKSMREHELGQKHLASIKKKNEGEKKEKVRIWCDICKIWTHNEKMMETHRLGKKHKALFVKHQRKPLAVLDTNLITTPVNGDLGEREVSKLHCLDKSLE